MLSRMIAPFLTVAGSTLGAILLGAGVLHLLPRLGAPGRSFSAAFCRAPLLDIPITYFTVLPLIVGPIVAGWRGFAGAIVGQVAGVLVWTAIHEIVHRKQTRGARIVKVINRAVGPARNYTATWVTALATPVFWIVRVAELIVYPPLVWLVDLPRYKHADWVNVSRQKFRGLVGHDLIWCLYCDWMTGVWSLASEMLRNVESFWCPIRFDNSKKCVNCATDFPDVANGWVSADGNIADVAHVLEQQYGQGQRPRAWFGHPVRITVRGRPADERSHREPVGV
jgi:hypothetical protein